MGPSERERNDPQGPETSGGSNGGNNGGNNGPWGGNGGQNGPYGGQNGGGSSRSNRLGGTQLYDAIYLASDDVLKTETGRKALIIFSDGVDRGSKETMSEAIDAAERANVSVYTIYFKGQQENQGGFPGMGRRGGMGGGYPGGGYPGGGYPGRYPGGGYPGGGRQQSAGVDGKKIMQEIATRTGARFYEAKKKENLEEIYNQIAQELRGQYLLSYTPDQVDNDGGYHKILLKAKKEDLIVTTREGYYAPGGDSR
jgi:VWFA-related protein